MRDRNSGNRKKIENKIIYVLGKVKERKGKIE
jgi:uncharacterized protein YjbJ (UPF0337 family)